MYTRFNTFLWTLSFKRCVSNFKTNSYLRTKGRFRSGPRGPWPLLLSGKLFSFVNVCRGWYFELCYLNIFSLINRALLIRKESVFEAIFNRKWPKLPECMQYYSSPTNRIWQFSGRQCCRLCQEVVLSPQSLLPQLALYSVILLLWPQPHPRFIKYFSITSSIWNPGIC